MNTALLYAILLLVLGLACCILEFTKYVKIRRCVVFFFVIWMLFNTYVMFLSLNGDLLFYHGCLETIKICLKNGRTDEIIESLDAYSEDFQAHENQWTRVIWPLRKQLMKIWLQPPQNTESQDQPANEREVPSE